MRSAISSPFESEPDHVEPFMDTPFMDTPFMDTPFIETPFMDTPFIETPFMDTPFIDTPFIETPFIETPFIETPFSLVTCWDVCDTLASSTTQAASATVEAQRVRSTEITFMPAESALLQHYVGMKPRKGEMLTRPPG